MEFYPEEIDGCKSEIEVWQQVKLAFKDDPGVAFHSYPLFEKEIDILIVHRHLGLWILECKGCFISNVESINGSVWKLKNFYAGEIKPIIQARKQMFELKNRLNMRLEFGGSLNFEFKVALPFITQKEWRDKKFDHLSTQGNVLTKESLKAENLKFILTKDATHKQKLTDEQWQSLMRVIGGSNDKPASQISISTSKESIVESTKINKSDNYINLSPISKIIKLPRTNPNIEFDNLYIHTSSSDNKANNVLYSVYLNEIELDNLLPEEDDNLILVDEPETDEVLYHRWKQNKKKHYTEDSIRIYLEEISRIRLLRTDEEIELAKKIADLLELERVRERLCEELERDPFDSEWAAAVQLPLPAFRYRLHIGRRAKDKLVKANLRLVVSIAKKYMNRGLSFQDLTQEGSLGLIRAAEKFDHEKGYKFSTYATWWIRQAITRAIADQSRAIRLPIHLYETISRIKKTAKLLSQEIGRKPTEEEIAICMEMSIEKLRFIAQSAAYLPISLETPIGKEEDFRLGDFIESDGETPEDQVSENLLREDLEKVLDSLSPRERDVLKLRYGLDDGWMKTLEEIGQLFNVTRERIRQIEAKALRKLRHPNRNSLLKGYLPEYQSNDLRHKRYEEKSKPNHSYTHKPENDLNYLQVALACHKHEDFLGAIDNFTYALKLDPHNAKLYYYRGVAEINLEYNEAAIKDFTHAIHLNPHYIDAYYQRGHVYYHLKDSQKAIEDYKKIISLNPKEALAYFYRGSVCSSLGQIQAAISSYNQAIEINPNLAEAFLHRGVAIYQLGDTYRAIEDYNQALHINANLAEACFHRGIAFDKLGQRYRAIEDYNRTLQINPDFVEAYSRRGFVLHQLGNYQAALEDYSEALEINSEDALTYYYRGLIYEKFSAYIKALEDFNEVLEINPDFVEVYFHIGSIYYTQGNYQKALESLDQLLKTNPNHAQAYNKRSSIRSALKDYQGAMEDLQKAAQFHY